MMNYDRQMFIQVYDSIFLIYGFNNSQVTFHMKFIIYISYLCMSEEEL